MYNYINFFDENQVTRAYLKDNQQTINSLEALSLGNMDKNIYVPFEDYQPKLLGSNEMTNFQSVNFMLIDIGLYLDVHPEDKKMKKIYDSYLNEYLRLKEGFKECPLTMTSKAILETPNWDYQKNWPFLGGDKNGRI